MPTGGVPEGVGMRTAHHAPVGSMRLKRWRVCLLALPGVRRTRRVHRRGLNEFVPVGTRRRGRRPVRPTSVAWMLWGVALFVVMGPVGPVNRI